MMYSILYDDSMMSLEFMSTIILKGFILSLGLSWMYSCSVLHTKVFFEMGPEIQFLEFLHECCAVARLWNTQEGFCIDPAHA